MIVYAVALAACFVAALMIALAGEFGAGRRMKQKRNDGVKKIRLK